MVGGGGRGEGVGGVARDEERGAAAGGGGAAAIVGLRGGVTARRRMGLPMVGRCWKVGRGVGDRIDAVALAVVIAAEAMWDDARRIGEALGKAAIGETGS